MQAWRKWEQFDGRSDPIVWLYTIARRTCQRLHRKRAGQPDRIESLDVLLPFGDADMAVVPDDDTALGGQIRREQREAVEQAIAALPDDFRMALILKDIVGFSVQEVAEVLDVKPATVKTRVHRARLLLRRALEGELPRRELPPPAYSKQVCMDLLQAKQDSMDRGVAMPNADAIICDRCEAVFKTLDLTRDVCGRPRRRGASGAPAEDADDAGGGRVARARRRVRTSRPQRREEQKDDVREGTSTSGVAVAVSSRMSTPAGIRCGPRAQRSCARGHARDPVGPAIPLRDWMRRPGFAADLVRRLAAQEVMPDACRACHPAPRLDA